jgi:hypothetical protein
MRLLFVSCQSKDCGFFKIDRYDLATIFISTIPSPERFLARREKLILQD